ncbi:MAG: DUF302 domain-containing protein [Draconibacterium sp.]
MSYSFNVVLKGKEFDAVIDLVTEELKKEGFGILTEIDVQQTLKNRIGADIQKYRILGACNPHFAYKAIQSEDKIGVFLPCNVVVQENGLGEIEVSAVDPVASMISVGNESLGEIAGEVQQKLKNVIESLT